VGKAQAVCQCQDGLAQALVGHIAVGFAPLGERRPVDKLVHLVVQVKVRALHVCGRPEGIHTGNLQIGSAGFDVLIANLLGVGDQLQGNRAQLPLVELFQPL
jgi:hypothetical protein